MVGSYRIVPVSSIVHPLGDPELSPEAERKMRRSVVEKALNTLKED
jgi:betaine reductase